MTGQFRWLIGASIMAGVLIAIVAALLFGILDIQCSAAKPYWHVEPVHETGVCLPYEVGGGPEGEGVNS